MQDSNKPIDRVLQQVGGSFASTQLRVLSMVVCFFVWKLWMPNDNSRYILIVLLASMVTTCMAAILVAVGINKTGRSLFKSAFLNTFVLWSVGTTIIFVALRVFLPSDIATNFNSVMVLFFAFFVLSLVIKLMARRKAPALNP